MGWVVDRVLPSVEGEPSLRDRNNAFGRIIGVTSIVGVTGQCRSANYAASKAGMIGMAKSSPRNRPRNVTVNCIAPGFIATPMTDALTDQQKQAIFAKIPAGAMGTPEDIAAAAVYLASDELAMSPGQTLVCEWRDDDGMIAIAERTLCNDLLALENSGA
ncbi:MAG: SDR family oxidoreductase [Parvularculaceae bacterium]